MKPTKDAIKQHTSRALERCLESFPRLDDKEWRKKASDRWTAKDSLAHLVIAQEEGQNRLIQQALAGEPANIPGFSRREEINGHNEQMLAKVRDLPVSDLLGRLKAAYAETMGILDGLSEPDLDKPASDPTWGCPGTVRDLFLEGYLHLPSHYQDIRRVAKKKLPHWVEASTPEEVHFQMDRTLHYMPLIYWSDRGGDMQATYLFTLEGEGGGQWAVRIGEGRAETECGAPDSFDIEVRTKPELWIDLSRNDLNAMWAITTRKLHLGGNAGLAMKLDTLFQVNE